MQNYPHVEIPQLLNRSVETYILELQGNLPEKAITV